MSIHATAIYEKGVLKLDAPLELAEQSRVTVEIVLETNGIGSHPELINDLEDPMSAVIGIGAGIVTDGADQHDHYIYGLPKKAAKP